MQETPTRKVKKTLFRMAVIVIFIVGLLLSIGMEIRVTGAFALITFAITWSFIIVWFYVLIFGASITIESKGFIPQIKNFIKRYRR